MNDNSIDIEAVEMSAYDLIAILGYHAEAIADMCRVSFTSGNRLPASHVAAGLRRMIAITQVLEALDAKTNKAEAELNISCHLEHVKGNA